MRYCPNPESVVTEMLASIGISKVEELFADIPEDLQLSRALNLGPGLTEMELRQEMQKLAAKNLTVEQFPCFLGAGAYDHYIPAALDQLLLRSEFYTAYTPYQAEISQGILQSIFEYQTMICMLSAMDVANASLYDGASALAEACNLACDATRRKKILVPATIHPEYIEVLKTYSLSGKSEIVLLPQESGSLSEEHLKALIDRETAAVIVQYPNFFGILEEIAPIEKAIHGVGGLLIMMVDPISLAILKPPGDWGADIAVGEGQSLGNNLSFGGPFLGFLAVSRKLMRKIPGRMVGQTLDREGRRAFVLTLQAREQHIRRQQATSNICSNQALNALAASIYLTLVGKQGLREIALRCHQLACYARQELEKIGLFLKYPGSFFREFAVKMDNPRSMNRVLLQHGIIGGFPLEDAMLLAFTEKRSKAEIDKLAAVLGGQYHE